MTDRGKFNAWVNNNAPIFDDNGRPGFGGIPDTRFIKGAQSAWPIIEKLVAELDSAHEKIRGHQHGSMSCFLCSIELPIRDALKQFREGLEK